MKYKSAKELALESAMSVIRDEPDSILDKVFLGDLFDCAWENQYEELPRQNAKKKLQEIIDRRASASERAESK